MADENEALDDEQADKDFASGFTTDDTPPATAAAPVTTDATPPAAETAPPASETPPAAEVKPPAPEFVQITREQLERLETAASSMLTSDKVKAIVTGTMGELEQRIVKKLQAATPAGEKVEIPADAFAEMEPDFPELAALIRKGLEKTLVGKKGTAEVKTDAPAPPPVVEQVDINKLVAEGIATYEKNREIDALAKKYPNWREIVGAAESPDKIDPKNEFRAWLSKQPADYQSKIDNSNSAAEISDAISKFNAAKEAAKKTPNPPPVKKIEDRRNVIRSAVQPTGDRGGPAQQQQEDPFEAGFKGESRRRVSG